MKSLRFRLAIWASKLKTYLDLTRLSLVSSLQGRIFVSCKVNQGELNGGAPNWGHFPNCPKMSRFVSVCPLLCFWGPERGQIGTKEDKRDKMGHLGQSPGTEKAQKHK